LGVDFGNPPVRGEVLFHRLEPAKIRELLLQTIKDFEEFLLFSCNPGLVLMDGGLNILDADEVSEFSFFPDDFFGDKMDAVREIQLADLSNDLLVVTVLPFGHPLG
jgi:hypothetical protein